MKTVHSLETAESVIAYNRKIRRLSEELVDRGYDHMDIDELKRALPHREIMELVGVLMDSSTPRQKIDYIAEGADSDAVASLLGAYLRNCGTWRASQISDNLLELMVDNALDFALPIIVDDLNQRMPQVIMSFERDAADSMDARDFSSNVVHEELTLCSVKCRQRSSALL